MDCAVEKSVVFGSPRFEFLTALFTLVLCSLYEVSVVTCTQSMNPSVGSLHYDPLRMYLYKFFMQVEIDNIV
jgi:hypothetical protein